MTESLDPIHDPAPAAETPGAGAELVKYDAMCRAIDAAYEVDEVKAIHDKAKMLQAAARVANNVDAEMRAYEIRMRAARKANQIYDAGEKAAPPKGNQYTGKMVTPDNRGEPKTLKDLGISSQQMSEWRKLNTLSDKQFEAALADGGKPSIDEIIGRSKRNDDFAEDIAAKTRFTESAMQDIKRIESEFHDSGEARVGARVREREKLRLLSDEQFEEAQQEGQRRKALIHEAQAPQMAEMTQIGSEPKPTPTGTQYAPESSEGKELQSAATALKAIRRRIEKLDVPRLLVALDTANAMVRFYLKSDVQET
jgi:hypothetical protein